MFRTPFKELGNPEKLKVYLSEFRSRQIDEAYRIVYAVDHM
jgi:Txe/YoeB family toxin of Txe-Axe toxin-antitoxin module